MSERASEKSLPRRRPQAIPGGDQGPMRKRADIPRMEPTAAPIRVFKEARRMRRSREDYANGYQGANAAEIMRRHRQVSEHIQRQREFQ